MCLIYAERNTPSPQPGTPEFTAMVDEYNAFAKEAGERGVLRSGEALMPVATATTVRVRDGESLVTDGPFAETAEILGGFYILDCKDLDEALEMAAKIPDARNGSVEVRPIAEIP
jgi:hypothetical protein